MIPDLPGHAVGVRLFDNDDQAVLYVDRNPDGHTLNCEITNLSERNLIIPKGSGISGGDNYHFAIQFRTGVLARNKSGAFEFSVDPVTGWSVSEIQATPDGVVVYFLNTGGARTLKSGESICFTINGLQANGQNGSRTTRVLIRYAKLFYEQSAEFLLAGTRLHFLNIINHLGHRNSPFQIVWVDSDEILNNGKEQVLELRIVNTSREARLDFDDLSQFVFSFHELDLMKDQRLVSNTEDIQFYLSLPKPGDNSEGFGNSAQTERVLMLKENKLTELKPRSSFSVWVKLKTDLPAGIANLHILQKNIPGFWDHTFILPVQKTVITSDKNNVGIGKKPSERLDVDGNIHASGKLMENGHALLPAGSIIMWSGEKVPEGWALCDGIQTLADGKTKTPNLLDRFIMGGTAKAFDDKDKTRVAGSNEQILGKEHLPDHSHVTHIGISPTQAGPKGNAWVLGPAKISDNHSTYPHSTSGVTGYNGKTAAFDNRPAFYTLAFIIKK